MLQFDWFTHGFVKDEQIIAIRCAGKRSSQHVVLSLQDSGKLNRKLTEIVKSLKNYGEWPLLRQATLRTFYEQHQGVQAGSAA